MVAPRLSHSVRVSMVEDLVLIRGGGDLGTGVAVRLWRSGFSVLILEAPAPMAVRRKVALSEAVYDGEARVEEVRARLGTPNDVQDVLARDRIAVLVDPDAHVLSSLTPSTMVDAIVAKRNLGTRRDMASCVIALGPGFTAGRDVDAVIETNRGPRLGRVIWNGEAEPNTGSPGTVEGAGITRVVRAPISGSLRTRVQIGDLVETGEVVAEIDDLPVRAQLQGVVRGLLRDGSQVVAGLKIGDVDPRLEPTLCTMISDKALAVAGGVLEATLMSLHGTGR